MDAIPRNRVPGTAWSHSLLRRLESTRHCHEGRESHSRPRDTAAVQIRMFEQPVAFKNTGTYVPLPGPLLLRWP